MPLCRCVTLLCQCWPRPREVCEGPSVVRRQAGVEPLSAELGSAARSGRTAGRRAGGRRRPVLVGYRSLFVLGTILTQVAPTGTSYESATDYVRAFMTIGAFVASMVAIFGLHALHRSTPRYGRVGMIRAVLAIIGYGIVALVVAAGMATGDPTTLIEVRLAGAITVLIGSTLLGVAILLARRVPWWCGVLLIIAFPLGDVADEIFSGAEGLLLGLLWGSVGVALLQKAGLADRAVVLQSAAAR